MSQAGFYLDSNCQDIEIVRLRPEKNQEGRIVRLMLTMSLATVTKYRSCKVEVLYGFVRTSSRITVAMGHEFMHVLWHRPKNCTVTIVITFSSRRAEMRYYYSTYILHILATFHKLQNK